MTWLLLVAALGIQPRALGAEKPQAPPVFEAAVEAVYIDVFVTVGNTPLRGLSVADFEVRDNGVPQQASLVPLDDVDLAAILVFDTSQSVRGPALRALKQAGHAFVEGLAPREKAALVTFGNEVLVRSPSSTDREGLRHALEGLEAAGTTRVFDALYVALERPWPGRPLIVLFTDGGDTSSWVQMKELLASARESNALVYALVPMSDTHEERPLREIAELTGGQLFALQGNNDLKAKLLDILAAMKSRYLLSYEPRGVSRTGRHEISVRVKGRGAKVRHRREYRVPAGVRPAHPAH
jgi:VWFA-related protein